MEKFQLIVIGGGAGGLVSASGAAQLGAKVALIDRKPLGGDCLHSGCVPTKSLVRAAMIAHECRRAGDFGIRLKGMEIDFQRVMERRHVIQEKIGEHDDPERFRKMGIEVIFGNGSFVDPHHFRLGSRVLKGEKFILSTGSSPVELPIPGLKESGYLTNETMLGLIELPKRLIVIGAGPIGMEYAQLMQRLGSQVTVIEKMDRIMSKDEPQLTHELHQIVTAEGVKILTSMLVERVERNRSSVVVYVKSAKGALMQVEGDQLLVAIGRAPNIVGLGLEEIGVKTTKFGITTDATMRTSAPNIYAVGDVTGPFPFTHMAEYQAGVAISNALFPLVRRKVDYRAVPWVTYTDPELARVGMSEEEARAEHGNSIEVLEFPMSSIDRGVIEGHTKGRAKVITSKKGKVLGASLLAHHAGDLLPQFALAVRLGLKVQQLAQTVLPYPTAGQICWRVSQQWYRKKLFDGPIGRFTRWYLKRGK